MLVSVERNDLEKVLDVMRRVVEHHKARDESNAALHLASTVRYSPLTTELEAQTERLDSLLGG